MDAHRSLLLFKKRSAWLPLLFLLASVSHLCGAQELASPNTTTDAATEDKPKTDDAQAGRVTVVAPKYLRPQSDYFVLVSLASSQAPATIDLQLTGARDSNKEQTEARSVLVQPSETQTVKFTIGDWPAAEYFLSVNAQAVDQSWSFQQETPIQFHARSYTGLIQTDKPLYKPNELVQFRALFLTETLAPLVLRDEFNVTVSDPRRNLVRQWSRQSNHRGLWSGELQLSDDPMHGDWTISVEARGQQFEKRFQVAEYVLPTFDVQLQLPPYATYNDSKVVATVRATYTYGKPVGGHVTLSVQPLVRFAHIDTRPLEQAQYRARLDESGAAEFELDLAKHLRQQADLFEREVEFFALVEEDLTGRKYNRTTTMKVYSRAVKIERLHAERPFKPGLSQLIQYKVAYQDDTPVGGTGDFASLVQLSYTHAGQQVAEFKLRPVNGLIEHQLEVPRTLRRPADRLLGRPTEFAQPERDIVPSYLNIRAQYRNQTHHLGQLAGFSSRSGHYMELSLPQLEQQRHLNGGKARSIQLGDKLRVRLRSTEPMPQTVTCQGLARGSLVWALGKDARNQSELEFEVQVDQRMAPQARVLCFYARTSGERELIADSLDLQVAGFMRNFVKLSPSRTEAKPGQQVDVDVFTKPSSLVGTLAIDQSVLLLRSGHDLSSQQLLEENARFSGSGSAAAASPRPARHASELFDSANMVVLTNNELGGAELLGDRGGELHLPISLLFASAVEAPAGNNIRLSKLLIDGEQLQPPQFRLRKDQRKDQLDPIAIRTMFAESWLWQNGTANSSGKLQLSGKIPDTITSWQLSAFSLSEAHGLGLSGASGLQSTIRVFKPFFVKLNLPYSVIRGETLSVQAVVFNYAKRPASATVTLDNSRGEFEFVEPANSVNDEQRSARASDTRQVRVPPNDGASVSFLVRPVKLGALDVKVVARSELAGDGLVRKLLVKPEGQTQHFNTAMLIRLPRSVSTENQESSANATNSSGSFRRNVTIEVPANAVRDSQRVYVSLIGDLLGAGLANVDDLLRLPYGCGEQNMINLVPNIVIHNYLKSSGRLRELQRRRAVRNIQTGYQRQLNYKRPDGSFSAFGSLDANGSVWLTAYVLRTLQQARAVLAELDPKVVRQAANFITRFALDDGRFEEVGMLHNQQLASASAQGSSVYLTAYALAALFEGPLSSGDGDANNQEQRAVIERGLDFLERKLDSNSATNYDLAIMAYTLQQASRQRAAERAYDQLWARAQRNQDLVWWWPVANYNNDTSKSDASPSSSLTDIGEFETDLGGGSSPEWLSKPTPSKPAPPLKAPLVSSKQSAHLFAPNSLAVETSSWALLAAVRRGDLERALPIVHWLVSQQNSNGGFASTQDTVLAIEALAAFAQAGGANQQQPLAMDVEFMFPRPRGSLQFRRNESSEQLSVGQSNALIQQQLRLADNVTWVQVQASGTGVAVVQVSWQYNLMVSAEEPAFYLSPILDRTSTVNYLQLSVCTFYKGPGESSNMAVAEIELPSGYMADAEALPGLRRHKAIKRVDTADGETKVIVYLDRVTRSEELCFTVPAHRSAKVSNNRPVPVTIYDYYDRKQAARIFYEPQLTSSCDICENDTCREQCNSKPKRSSKLISLHEQRRLVAEQTPTGPSAGKERARLANITNNPTTLSHDPELPRASDLLPLKPVLQTIKSVFENDKSQPI